MTNTMSNMDRLETLIRLLKESANALSKGDNAEVRRLDKVIAKLPKRS